MDAFWKWLMRANARAVCFGLLALFLGVCGFWGWKLSQPPQVSPSRPSPPPPERPKRSLELLAYLDAESARTNGSPKTSPFLTPYTPPAPVATNTPPPPNMNTTVVVPVKPIKPPKLPDPPKPPPPADVSITFRGAMQRTDGSILAWMEVKGDSDKKSFFRTNDQVQGLRVDSISTTGSVTLVREDGTTIELGVGGKEIIPATPGGVAP